MTEWKTYTLKELSKGRGEYGIGAPAVPFDKEKYTYLRITDINDDGTLNTSGMMSVDADDAEEYILEKNDIVFARTGNSTGRSYFYDGRDGELVYAGFLIRFRLDETKVNPKILKYYTHSKPYYDWVKSFDTGGTRGNINAKTYGDMPIYLPPRHIQDRIVGILGAIDDKIENNRRINTNLELQAQTLYKQWFVDFEFPNEEGKPYKSSGGKMADSELGPIPEGWSVGKLEDMGTIVGGGTPSKAKQEYYTSNGIAWVTPKDLSITHAKFTAKGEVDITDIGYANSSAKMMPRGSILFSSRAPIGYISIAKNDICTNQGFKSVVPNNGCTAFVYYFLLSNTENIESKATGSTFKEASGALMKSLELVIPSDDILEKFEKIMSPIFEAQEKFEAENKTLVTLRDTLLPKLMNGEIKI